MALTKAQIEARKLALLQAASHLVRIDLLHSNTPRDADGTITIAVKAARAILQKIDETEHSQPPLKG